jgi:hypothetical protein
MRDADHLARGNAAGVRPGPAISVNLLTSCSRSRVQPRVSNSKQATGLAEFCVIAGVCLGRTAVEQQLPKMLRNRAGAVY